MRDKKIKGYDDVVLEANGLDLTGKNPMANLYRYEFALYKVVSSLFAGVTCRSMCVKTLEMYFNDLPHPDSKAGADADSGERKKTASEALIDEVAKLVEKDVIGKISFPMMNVCRADAFILPEEDKSHSLVFSDGIYSFSLRLKMEDGKHPAGIEVNGGAGEPQKEPGK